jgi:hypothetical protein
VTSTRTATRSIAGGERSPGNVVGWLPVEAAEFDPTKRAAISAAVVDYLR